MPANYRKTKKELRLKQINNRVQNNQNKTKVTQYVTNNATRVLWACKMHDWQNMGNKTKDGTVGYTPGW